MSHLVSNRGHFLLLPSLPAANDRPVVTVEAYTKWYGLYVVRPDAQVEEVPFPTHETLTPYIDHVPNPAVVEAWAEANGYEVDEMALEMMIGRWQRAPDIVTCSLCGKHVPATEACSTFACRGCHEVESAFRRSNRSRLA